MASNRSNFTNNFIKDIIQDMFNGNMGSGDPYINENSEDIILKDTDTGEETVVDLAKYLNIEFYDFSNKLEVAERQGFNSVEDWLDSISASMNRAFALVEVVDERASNTADIDNGEKVGRITFLMQTSKVDNLDYYASKIRNKYIGEPFIIQNSYGKRVKAYFNLGTLLYDEEPSNYQTGYSVVVSCNFTISYMMDASSYDDIKIEMSLDNGKHYYDMPLTQETWQLATSSAPVPKANRPDITGQLVQAIFAFKTFTFYDYNMKLSKEINRIFWRVPAVIINGIKTKKLDSLNIPVTLRLVCDNNVYIYDDVIDNIQKVVQNGTYNTTSITLKGNAIENERFLTYFGADGITTSPTIFEVNKALKMGEKQTIITANTSNIEELRSGSVASVSVFVKADDDCEVAMEFEFAIPSANDSYRVKKNIKLSANEITPILMATEGTTTAYNDKFATFTIQATSLNKNINLTLVSDSAHACGVALID